MMIKLESVCLTSCFSLIFKANHCFWLETRHFSNFFSSFEAFPFRTSVDKSVFYAKLVSFSKPDMVSAMAFLDSASTCP